MQMNLGEFLQKVYAPQIYDSDLTDSMIMKFDGEGNSEREVSLNKFNAVIKS